MTANTGYFAAEGVALPSDGSPHEFGLHFNRGLGAVLAGQGCVDCEIDNGVKQDCLDPALNTVVGVARQFCGIEFALGPTQVLAIDAVGGNRGANGINNGHSAITQPTIHVLVVPAHPLDDTEVLLL